MAWAQKPSFEAASIKPNASGKDGGSIGPRGAALLATNVTLESLLVYAYSPPGGLFLRQQIISGPAWMGTDRFDIEAKTGENEHVPNTQMRVMMQSLLEDRFQLKAHRETRELPVYDLVPIKGGPQLSADRSRRIRGRRSSTSVRPANRWGTCRAGRCGWSRGRRARR